MTFDPSLYQYKYIALFLFAFVEGPTLALFCGFLVRQGVISLIPTLAILVFANFAPDVIMYFVGKRLRRHGATAFVKKYPAMKKYFEGIEIMWQDFFRMTLIFAKVSLGLAMPFLASAGFSGVPFRKYITHTVGLDLILISTLIALGAVTGTAYERIVAYSNYLAAIFAIVLIMMFSVALRIVQRRIRAELNKKMVKPQ